MWVGGRSAWAGQGPKQPPPSPGVTKHRPAPQAPGLPLTTQHHWGLGWCATGERQRSWVARARRRGEAGQHAEARRGMWWTVSEGEWAAETVKRPPQRPAQPPGGGGGAPAQRAMRSRGRGRSVGGCRRGSQGSGRQREATKAWSTVTQRSAVGDRACAVTSANCSFRVVRTAVGSGRTPWNRIKWGGGGGGGQGCIGTAVHRRRRGVTSPDPPLPPSLWTPSPPPSSSSNV